MFQLIRLLVLLLSCMVGSTALAQHGGDMLIGSAVDRGGRLAIDYDFTRRVRVTLNLSGGGQSFHSGTAPGFDLLSMATSGHFPLRSNTTVNLRIIEAEAGVSVKIGDTTVDAPGESATIGTTPSLHEHPQWRLLLPDGVTAERRIVFRLTTTSRIYEESVDYTLVVSNLSGDATPSPTPSPTASVSATTTPSLTPQPTRSPTPEATPTSTLSVGPPSATPTPNLTPTSTAGRTATPTPRANLDANCDRRMSAADIVAVVRAIAGEPSPCGADANGDGQVDLSDLTLVTRAIGFGVDVRQALSSVTPALRHPRTSALQKPSTLPGAPVLG